MPCKISFLQVDCNESAFHASQRGIRCIEHRACRHMGFLVCAFAADHIGDLADQRHVESRFQQYRRHLHFRARATGQVPHDVLTGVQTEPHIVDAALPGRTLLSAAAYVGRSKPSATLATDRRISPTARISA